jgi:hypothetical protein
MGKKTIVIIGCGSSGTAYTSAVMRRAGLGVGHENLMEDGICSWLVSHCSYSVVAPPDYFGNPTGVRYRDIEGDKAVFHQVRHPVKTISTFQRTRPQYWEYAEYFIKQLENENTLLERCMLYWFLWNKMCEEQSLITYRVEDLPTVWDTIMHLSGRPEHCSRGEGIFRFSKPVHSFKGHYEPKTWEDLERVNEGLCNCIKEKAVQYGYDVP